MQKRIPLRDQAYNAIKRMIVTHHLRPGEVLEVTALSQQFNLGRTPIRQAIDKLVGDGLVEVIPRKGSIVKPISLDEILNIIDVRLVNESYAVRKAAELASPEIIQALHQVLAGMRTAVNNHDVEELADLDQQFHALIAKATRNIVLVELLRNLHERSARIWFTSLSSNEHHLDICDEHAAIVEAIAEHNPDKAEQAMRIHIESFANNITHQA